jgi:peptidoglycan hydrolase CwlO-like protein
MKTLVQTLIALFILGVIIYFLLKSSDEKINRIRLENKQLELKIDSINNANKVISLQLDNFQKKIDSIKAVEKQLSIQYEENKKQIKNTQKKYEKNNRIDNFSSPDIIRYFTDSL